MFSWLGNKMSSIMSPSDTTTAPSSTNTTVKGGVGYRLLTLEGETGAVFCRVHDEISRRTLPGRSEKGTWEFATRSLMRMRNLTVFRGRDRSASMVGPGDYFCNVEQPHASCFTIELEDLFPKFVPHPLPSSADATSSLPPPPLRSITPSDVIRVRARWLSGQRQPDLVNIMRDTYRTDFGITDCFGGSLFPSPGLLEISPTLQDHYQPTANNNATPLWLVTADGVQPTTTSSHSEIVLPFVDATTIDLSNFGARLVRNDQPFRIVEEKLREQDEFRPVSYEFGEHYGQGCVEHGGGLFLETHDFTQTMTPLDSKARGFITLGRWVSPPDEASPSTPPTEDPSSTTYPTPLQQLELIAVRIPFGWTLLVDKGCMHGDSTFIGQYMMSMTSSHITMRTADTVFLKDAATKRNISLTCPQHFHPTTNNDGRTAASCYALTGGGCVGVGGGGTSSECTQSPKPIILYKDATLEELEDFHAVTKGVSFMLQPFSRISWWSTMYRRVGWFPGMPATAATTNNNNNINTTTDL